jgi:membrane associated rhomboid family serine protease
MASLRSFLPPLNTTASKLAVALLVGSVVSALVGVVGYWLVLQPGLVLRSFALWQLVSYAFIETSTMGVIFGCLILWSLGGALEQSWGGRRTLVFAIGVTAMAGVLTTLLALVVPTLRHGAFAGGNVMATSLWVAYGLSFGQGQTNFWGVPVTGYQFAAIGAGFVLLNAVFAPSVLVVVPDAFALVLTFVTVRFGGPQVWFLRASNWRLQRQLRGRAKHLRVIGKDRNHPSDSDRFLQ